MSVSVAIQTATRINPIQEDFGALLLVVTAAARALSEVFIRKKVLVVDDNRDAANMLARVFRMLGYDAVTAYDGEEGLIAFLEYNPPYIFLDIAMPGMDGHELARRIRQQQGTAAPTLIAVTGFGQEDDKRRSREAGFDHHLTKPVDIADLEGILGKDI